MRAPILVAVLLAAFLYQTVAFGTPVEVSRAEDVGMSSERLAYMKSYFEGMLQDEETGGFQILISRRGKVVMFENLGMANVEESIPVTDETLFRIFSMTKPVMGVAMMMLYEEGQYSLADPLSKHIPEFAELRVYAGEDDEGNMTLEPMQREPTIHDLLQHTAGFTYGIFGDSAVDKEYIEKDVLDYDQTMDEFIEKIASIPLLFQPGSRWNYSISVDLQGYLIEKWTGMKLGDFLQERIFDPLGMDQTMAWVPPDQAGLLANVYTHDEDGNRSKYEGNLATNHYRAPGAFSGGAQLVSTGDDYWRFCQMILNGGEFEGKRFLSPRTVKLMSENRLREPASLPNGLGFGLNFGVMVDSTQANFPASNGEFGWGGLATTTFWIDPEEDMVVIMLTQYLPWRGDSYRDLMHRLVRPAIIE
ncbi:Penicillin-binding protein, beta-lactamase class C [uncultured Woeseiaceae bacterium]|uniref:Penicillin-binding protein, beta-lactamase class C n=1 Tax=uncultured Woeseiaceae bacterium TaxID=1983305 RepID=A0A7D9H409_9GAMM|nr:Penicillin-binding protein, beta-lactamase class C [uncultured Woeseiaceae bacterium]